MRTRATEMFGLDLPVFAFSHCRDVVAAVSKAGGLGVLGALAFSPEQLEVELAWIDDHVDGRPYGVDVVMPASYAGAGGQLDPDRMEQQLADMIPQEHKDFIERVLSEHGVPPLNDDGEQGSGLLGWTHEGARPQVDIALSHPICLLVNALGPPPKDVVDLAHEHGVKVAALVGSLAHAERQVNQGVDMIVAQGYEAGGHTGDVGDDGPGPGGRRRGRRPGPRPRRGWDRLRTPDGRGDGAGRGGCVDRLDLADDDGERHRARGGGPAHDRRVARHSPLPGADRQAGPAAAHPVDRGVGAARLARLPADAVAVHGDRGGPTPASRSTRWTSCGSCRSGRSSAG